MIRRKPFTRFKTTITLMLLAAWIQNSTADIIGDANSAFKLQGFMSLVAGKFYGGDEVPNPSNNVFAQGTKIPCPCFVSNWANAGVYSENRLSMRPDSIAGLQADYNFDPNNSFSAQTTSRGGILTPTVQWFYFAHQLSPHWDIHVGRQRIPLFYYSSSEDVGVSYPWVVPPEEVYGYEATNYNGISTSYKSSWHGIASRIEAYTGFEYIHNSPYAGLIDNGQQSSVRWKNMLGSAWTLSSV